MYLEGFQRCHTSLLLKEEHSKNISSGQEAIAVCSSVIKGVFSQVASSESFVLRLVNRHWCSIVINEKIKLLLINCLEGLPKEKYGAEIAILKQLIGEVSTAGKMIISNVNAFDEYVMAVEKALAHLLMAVDIEDLEAIKRRGLRAESPLMLFKVLHVASTYKKIHQVNPNAEEEASLSLLEAQGALKDAVAMRTIKDLAIWQASQGDMVGALQTANRVKYSVHFFSIAADLVELALGYCDFIGAIGIVGDILNCDDQARLLMERIVPSIVTSGGIPNVYNPLLVAIAKLKDSSIRNSVYFALVDALISVGQGSKAAAVSKLISNGNSDILHKRRVTTLSIPIEYPLEGAAPFHLLSAETAEMIFDQLEARDFQACSQVNKSWSLLMTADRKINEFRKFKKMISCLIGALPASYSAEKEEIKNMGGNNFLLDATGLLTIKKGLHRKMKFLLERLKNLYGGELEILGESLNSCDKPFLFGSFISILRIYCEIASYPSDEDFIRLVDELIKHREFKMINKVCNPELSPSVVIRFVKAEFFKEALKIVGSSRSQYEYINIIKELIKNDFIEEAIEINLLGEGAGDEEIFNYYNEKDDKNGLIDFLLKMKPDLIGRVSALVRHGFMERAIEIFLETKGDINFHDNLYKTIIWFEKSKKIQFLKGIPLELLDYEEICELISHLLCYRLSIAPQDLNFLFNLIKNIKDDVMRNKSCCYLVRFLILCEEYQHAALWANEILLEVDVEFKKDMIHSNYPVYVYHRDSAYSEIVNALSKKEPLKALAIAKIINDLDHRLESYKRIVERLVNLKQFDEAASVAKLIPKGKLLRNQAWEEIIRAQLKSPDKVFALIKNIDSEYLKVRILRSVLEESIGREDWERAFQALREMILIAENSTTGCFSAERDLIHIQDASSKGVKEYLDALLAKNLVETALRTALELPGDRHRAALMHITDFHFSKSHPYDELSLIAKNVDPLIYPDIFVHVSRRYLSRNNGPKAFEWANAIPNVTLRYNAFEVLFFGLLQKEGCAKEIKALQKMLSESPDNEMIVNRLGNFFLRQAAIDHAIRLIVTWTPEHITALISHLEVLTSLGKSKKIAHIACLVAKKITDSDVRFIIYKAITKKFGEQGNMIVQFGNALPSDERPLFLQAAGHGSTEGNSQEVHSAATEDWLFAEGKP